MNATCLRTLAVVLALFPAGFAETAYGEHPEPPDGIPASRAAEYVHAVIEAGRHIYSREIADRLSRTRSLPVSEDWQNQDALPLPAQFLKMSSEISNNRGIGMRYRLTSLWPINPQNAPRTEAEKRGLEMVRQNPDQPFTWVVQAQGMWYFQAVYPDRAVSASCASCHNQHPDSPRKDFKEGDVMGGIVIDLPLGRRYQKPPGDTITLPPEVVTDYVHSVLESDRIVYSRNVVDHLQRRKVLEAREDWGETQALLLPAQFILAASEFIRSKNLGLDFQLISLWPINPRNGPAGEFERRGLESVEIHPVRPYIDRIQVGRKRFFQSVYPDLAVAETCVTCHNNHPGSPKRDYRLFDVMGGIVVTLSLN